MQRHSIRRLAAGAAAAVLVLLGWGITRELSARSDREAAVRTLPEFTFRSPEGSEVRKEDFATPAVLVFFSSECRYCKYLIEQMLRFERGWAGAQLVFVTGEDAETARRFRDRFGLANRPDTHVLLDVQDTGRERFGVRTVPHTFVYAADGTLAGQFRGAAAVRDVHRSLTGSGTSQSTEAGCVVKEPCG